MGRTRPSSLAPCRSRADFLLQPSLALRLGLTIVLFESLLVAITFALNIAGSPAGSVAFLVAQDAVTQAVTRDAAGSLVLRQTPALETLLLDNPAIRVAVLEKATLRLVPGSSPVLAAAAEAVRTSGLDLRQLATDAESTSAGEFTIVIYSDAWTWTELWPALLSFSHMVGRSALPLTFPLAAASTLVAWLTLRPVRRAARQAEGIGVRSLSERLPERRLPGEVLPLVHAVNDLLARLEQDVGRQRRFVANAAHELRTPIAILRARIDSMPTSPMTEELAGDADRMTRLVRQMLTVARLSDSALPMDELIDLASRVRHLVEEYAPLAISRGRGIGVDVVGPPATVLCNEQAFDSALLNLLDNATKAEPAGGTVEVVVGPGASIEVRDHGAGLPREDVEKMFDAFWRKDRNSPGSGLGLAIVRECMRLQGGSTDVWSSPGAGTVLGLRFATR